MKHSHFPYTSTYSSTPHNKNRKHNIHHIPYTNTQHTSTLQGSKHYFQQRPLHNNIPTVTTTDIKTNMRHIHTSIVSKHLATRGNNKILCTPPPHISSSEEILPPSLVATLPNSEQINLPSSNHTYTKSTPKHIHHHYAPSITSSHTTHIISSTAPTYAPGFVDRPRWSDGATGQMVGEADWWTTTGRSESLHQQEALEWIDNNTIFTWVQKTQHTRGVAVTAVWQIVSIPPAPSNRGLIYRFCASRSCGPAAWLTLLFIKEGDVETNPGPTTTRKQVWMQQHLPLGAAKMRWYPPSSIYRYLDLPSTQRIQTHNTHIHSTTPPFQTLDDTTHSPLNTMTMTTTTR